jgi:CheY-like chemotaxis protein
MAASNEVKLLIVEDDEVDLIGMKRAIGKLCITNPLYVARDGVEALDMLRGQNGHEKLAQPYMVLLDLNMPRMSGLEFLEEIRQDDALKGTVIFVMTTSSDQRDIAAAYDRSIAGYIVKSGVEQTFPAALKMLDHYWRIVELPSS